MHEDYNHHENHEHHHHKEHDKHVGHSVDMFRQKFWACLLLTIPVLVYSPHIQDWFNFTPVQFPGSDYIPFIFSTFIFFYGGMVFLKSALTEIRGKLPGMMTLISIAITTSYVYSVAVQFGLPGESFFWELATLVTIMLLGHWLEMASINKAENALDAISKLLPDKAEKLVNGKPQSVLVSTLKVDDMVLVRPGASIAVDGIVVEGASSVEESAITGESIPVTKKISDEVTAGTINQDGSLTIKVAKIGDDTALAGIKRLVAEAQASKSQVQVLADKAALALTIIAIIAGLLTFIVWLLVKDANFALERSVTVLIVACPHALGLAVPLVVSISTSLYARNGLLIRRRLALETARNLGWVLFDKTGTLTLGNHGVTDIFPSKGFSRNEILKMIASLEQKSEHTIGKGIVVEASQKNVGLDKVSAFSAVPGLGVEGKLHGKKYMVTNPRYVAENNLTVPGEILSSVQSTAGQGKTVVYLIQEKQVLGAIALADIIRDESKQTISMLKKLGIKSAMITGDSKEVAHYVSEELGLNQFFAEVKPEDKANKVKELQTNGESVAMVGDGINDAVALTQADVGIAIGAGTDTAIKSADVILVKSNPGDVVKVIQLSKATYRKMKQNLVWAVGYNIFAIPLASGVLYSYGFTLAPAIGAVLMSLSTVIVAFNAQMLRRLKL